MKMQISTDYALRALQYLHGNPDQICTATEIAEATEVSYSFFIKVANLLREDGLVSVKQGRHGGYVLGKAASDITLYEVLLCIEGKPTISPCLQGSPCIWARGVDCKLRNVLGDIQEDIVSKLSSYSVADLANETIDRP